MTRPDPPQRLSLTCARPRCRKRLPKLAVEHGDPFCSNECAREYHGCRISKRSIWGKQPMEAA